MTDPPAAVKAGRATELGVRRGFTLAGSALVGLDRPLLSLYLQLSTQSPGGRG